MSKCEKCVHFGRYKLGGVWSTNCELVKDSLENNGGPFVCKYEEKTHENMSGDETINWLTQIKEKYIHGGDEEFDARRRKAIDRAIRSLEAWDEIINHLEATAKELLDREDEKQSYAFAKGITFSVSMIKSHMKEVKK